MSNSNSRGGRGLKQPTAMLSPPIGLEARVRSAAKCQEQNQL
jgi:hypothetical protein